MKLCCTKRWIALILAFLFLFTSLPMYVMAEDAASVLPTADQASLTTAQGTTTSLFTYEDDTAIGEVTEVVELRDRYTKHFRLADGTYQAVQFSNAVHRKDMDGVWQDIDNSVTLQTTGLVRAYTTSDMRVSFAEKYRANAPLLTLSENGYAITMTLMEGNTSSDHLTTGTTEIAPAITNVPARPNTTVYETVEEACRIDTRSTVRYNGIRVNTDVEYPQIAIFIT